MATLAAKGFDTFLPKGRKTLIHHRSKRVIEREFPLMVGYLFLAMPVDATQQHWGVARTCDGVHGILGMGDRYVPVPEREVMVLMDAEADGRLRFEAAKRNKGQHSFVDGMEARIALGPFTGFVGQVVDASCRKAIRLLISIFGGLSEVVVPVDELEAV